jgi:predicted ATP-grasp superfamily ATP-dependent carboligase
MNVIITDGENRSALAATRSLGKRGYRVLVTATKMPCIASSSKYCTAGFRVPNPLNEGLEYVNAIKSIADKENARYILPMTEQSIQKINFAREVFPAFTMILCAESREMAAVSDKVRLFKMAKRLKIAIPRTIYISNPSELPDSLQLIINYPVVVKPAFSKIACKDGFISTSVKYANSQEDLRQLYNNIPYLRYPSMIQEKIVGPGTGLFTLFDKDKHLALFSHRRLHEKPPSGGVSVISESIPLDMEMVASSERLLSEVGWQGVAMVEFKRDVQDGQAKLMEVNGRFWGSLQLAIACGVDFPSLLLDHVQGNNLSMSNINYLKEHKLKWLFGVLDCLIIRIKNLNLSKNAPLKKKDFFDLMQLWERNSSFDVFRLDDIKPFICEAYHYIRQTFERKNKGYF